MVARSFWFFRRSPIYPIQFQKFHVSILYTILLILLYFQPELPNRCTQLIMISTIFGIRFVQISNTQFIDALKWKALRQYYKLQTIICTDMWTRKVWSKSFMSGNWTVGLGIAQILAFSKYSDWLNMYIIITMPRLKSFEIELACFDDNTIKIKGQISMSHKFPLQIIILALNVPTNLYQYHYHKLVTINIHIT